MSESLRVRASVTDWFSLVRFSHSIFALPFALCGAWLAGGGVPPLRTLILIVVCAVAARTAAMSFNRLVDRDVDAANPRTKNREIPSGKLSIAAVTTLVLISCAVFVGASYALHTLAGNLSWPVLAIVLSYSLFKRFSWLAHIVLGVALALAPLGAWIAVRGAFDAALAPVLWLALAVTTWVAGFDLIYACQDAAFDEEAGLHSIPARFGVGFALNASSILHVATTAALALVGVSANLGWIWFAGVAAAALALVLEHRLVSKDDLSRVNAAFFTVNGWIGVGLFVGMVLDRAFLG